MTTLTYGDVPVAPTADVPRVEPRAPVATQSGVRAPTSVRWLLASAGLALAGMTLVLAWIYASFVSPQWKLCTRQLSDGKVYTLCQPATSDPLAVALVTGTVLLPAAAAFAVSRRKQGIRGGLG